MRLVGRHDNNTSYSRIYAKFGPVEQKDALGDHYEKFNLSGYNALEVRPCTSKMGFRKVENISGTLMACIISIEAVILGAVNMYVHLSFLRFSL